jgi:tricorn protease
MGCVPFRLTAHGYTDRVVDWTNDSKRILFASGRESGKARFNQLYTVSASGGSDEKLPLAYAEYASYSPDGKELAVTFRSQVGRNWKRYRGGWKADIHIFNLQTQASQSVNNPEDAGSEFPMWHENSIYFLIVDQNCAWIFGAADLKTKQFEQDKVLVMMCIILRSAGVDIVFEAGGKLYVFNISSQNKKK